MFPPSQRVIAYTNLSETPSDILDIYEEARTKSPDVIKLVTLANEVGLMSTYAKMQVNQTRKDAGGKA